MDISSIIQTMTVYAIPLILAITIHESAHGYVAKLCGDNTAYVLGRLTLNPLKHIDLVGTILVPGALLILSAVTGMSGIIFGWAKPVPINFRRLRNPKTDMIWVAVAGPGSNLIQAVIWGLLLKILVTMGFHEEFFINMCVAGIGVNLVLMALNLIPIPPLDGGRIVSGLLPAGMAWQYSRIEPYGMYILFALILTGTLSFFMRPFMKLGYAVVQWFL